MISGYVVAHILEDLKLLINPVLYDEHRSHFAESQSMDSWTKSPGCTVLSPGLLQKLRRGEHRTQP